MAGGERSESVNETDSLVAADAILSPIAAEASPWLVSDDKYALFGDTLGRPKPVVIAVPVGSRASGALNDPLAIWNCAGEELLVSRRLPAEDLGRLRDLHSTWRAAAGDPVGVSVVAAAAAAMRDEVRALIARRLDPVLSDGLDGDPWVAAQMELAEGMVPKAAVAAAGDYDGPGTGQPQALPPAQCECGRAAVVRLLDEGQGEWWTFDLCATCAASQYRGTVEGGWDGSTWVQPHEVDRLFVTAWFAEGGRPTVGMEQCWTAYGRLRAALGYPDLWDPRLFVVLVTDAHAGSRLDVWLDRLEAIQHEMKQLVPTSSGPAWSSIDSALVGPTWTGAGGAWPDGDAEAVISRFEVEQREEARDIQERLHEAFAQLGLGADASMDEIDEAVRTARATLQPDDTATWIVISRLSAFGRTSVPFP